MRRRDSRTSKRRDGDLVARLASEQPRALAIACEDGDCDYAELHTRVSAAADAMRAHGVNAGHLVGLNAETSRESIVIFWAIQRLGATAVLFSPKWPESYREEVSTNVLLDWQIAGTAPRRCVRSPDSNSPSCGRKTLHPANSNMQDSDGWATVLFSSGSSGSPKPIVHRQSAHVASASGAHDNLPFGLGDRWLWSLPWFHVSGLSILYRAALTGGTVLIPPSDRPLEQVMMDAAPTHLSLVPTQLKRLLDVTSDCPKCLKGVLLGGAPIPRETLMEAVSRGWPIHTTYGLTEMASQVTTTRIGADDEELQTAGYPLLGREVAINNEGHILVRGGMLCLGYLNAGCLTPIVDDTGWFDTRDLGFWDACGRLVVTGRADHLFISGGENIYPEEIERALLDISGVIQACVVAIPDNVYGSRPVAFVDSPNLAAVNWKAVLRNRLPAFKIPDSFLPWPEGVGLKPDRRRLQRLAQQHGDQTS